MTLKDNYSQRLRLLGGVPVFRHSYHGKHSLAFLARPQYDAPVGGDGMDETTTRSNCGVSCVHEARNPNALDAQTVLSRVALQKAGINRNLASVYEKESVQARAIHRVHFQSRFSDNMISPFHGKKLFNFLELRWSMLHFTRWSHGSGDSTRGEGRYVESPLLWVGVHVYASVADGPRSQSAFSGPMHETIYRVG